jgi:hypothetical protein
LDESALQELEKEADEPLFIPFPGTTKKVEPRPYKGSDPEWQGYIKFAKDRELGAKVRSE